MPATPAETRAQDQFGLTGTVLDRKYRVDRVVAEGGFGVVFVGHHLVLDARIAIKVLKIRRDVRRDDLLARFLAEARTMARLRHPHIVSVLDSGVEHVGDDGAALPWIVLEWLEGPTLRNDLERRRGRGGRSREQCLELMRPVLEAIAYAHAEGVAHRDIKPGNIVLVDTPLGPAPRVLDFGIAKIMERDEQAGTGATETRGPSGMFSPKYAAPEQVSGARTGPWTDVHALALVLSEMLIDAPPYPADDSTDICRFVFDERRPTPGRFGVDVGVWEPILARALSLRPGDRHEHAAELLLELEAALGQRSLPLAAVAPAPEVDPPADRGAASSAEDRTFETLVTGAAAVTAPRSPLRYGVHAATALAILGASMLAVRVGTWSSGETARAPVILATVPGGKGKAAPVDRAPVETNAPVVSAPVSSTEAPRPPASAPGVPSSVATVPAAANHARKGPPPARAASSAVSAASSASAETPARAAVTSGTMPAPYRLE